MQNAKKSHSSLYHEPKKVAPAYHQMTNQQLVDTLNAKDKEIEELQKDFLT